MGEKKGGGVCFPATGRVRDACFPILRASFLLSARKKGAWVGSANATTTPWPPPPRPSPLMGAKQFSPGSRCAPVLLLSPARWVESWVEESGPVRCTRETGQLRSWEAAGRLLWFRIAARTSWASHGSQYQAQEREPPVGLPKKTRQAGSPNGRRAEGGAGY